MRQFGLLIGVLVGSWYGGDIPLAGPSDPSAESDMNAWASAGALDN